MNKILLVEDREDDIIMARRTIHKMAISCELTVARDGVEALGLIDGAHERQFDLVLLDIQIPKLDGLEVLRRIRGNELTAGLAVVILTTSSSKADMSEAAGLNADSYVTKSLGIKEFEGQMKIIFDRFFGPVQASR
jgi:two-component system, response regulator